MRWNLFQSLLERVKPTMSFSDWSDCLVVRVALGPIPYASEKNKPVHFTINRDARGTRSRAYFATLNSAPFESEELIYARLVADIASLSSVGRAPGCSWKFQTSQQTPGCPQFKSGSGDQQISTCLLMSRYCLVLKLIFFAWIKTPTYY